MSDPHERPDEAIDTIRAFMDANRLQDEAGMRACLSRNTLESGSFSGPDGHPTDYYLGEPRREGDHFVVPVRMVPPGAGEDSEEFMDLPCVVVDEDGALKFDLAATMDLAFGGDLEDAVDEMAGAMAEAMDGVGEALGEAFGTEAGADEGEAQRWDDVPLEPSEEEWLPLRPMTLLPVTSEAVARALGFEVPVEMDLEGLLRPFGEEQKDQLIGWFEGELFAGWPEMLAEVNGIIPLANRLRGIRIEVAGMAHNRLIALDGHDLVYRIRLPDGDGSYGDEEIREMLAGVLAGLPESIDPHTVGHRLLPMDDETPNRDIYFDRVLPRHMRRISEVVGHHVDLYGNWDDLLGGTGETTGLYLWATGRILGAVALACTDESRREKIARELRSVRFDFVNDPDDRGAWFDEGELEVALSPFRGEAGCLYEHEIARELPGEPSADS